MSERCLIFLDVDGVLNSMRSIAAYRDCRTAHLDTIAIRLLDRLSGALAADGWAPEVVISSTWRMLFPDTHWWDLLWLRHDCANLRTSGKTPEFHDNEPNRRGREVAEWLRAHGGCAPYVCLDDDRDFLPTQPLVWVDPGFGLQVADIDAAFKAITGKPMPGLPRIVTRTPEPVT